MRSVLSSFLDLRRADGFSLTELLVVLVIVGILALLAIPRFLTVTTRAKTAEAKLQLRQVHTLMQTYFFEHDAYVADLPAIGYEQALLKPDGGNAYYRVTVERAEGRTFTATATAVVDFDGDGTLNVWAIDQDGRLTERIPD